MPAITPSFLFDFESNMQAITENEYQRFLRNLYWQKITKVRPSGSKREIIAWLLSTAQIYDQGLGGNIQFDDLVSVTTEYDSKNAGAGLKLRRDQLEDIDGNGIDLAAKWSSDMGSYMAYWPQKQVAALINNGETGLAYDAQPFFSAAHPLNPYNTAAGTYKNLWTGGNALPIDSSQTIDVAFANLGKAIANVAAIKMPNGVDPRFLTTQGARICCPPALVPRVQQLTNAKFIAQAAASGGGAADVEAVINNWGLQPPIEIPELAGVDDTSWYLSLGETNSTQLGAFTYVDREAFKITYYTGSGGGYVDAILDRAREFEWHCQGRNVAGYGHPYAFHKFKAA